MTFLATTTPNRPKWPQFITTHFIHYEPISTYMTAHEQTTHVMNVLSFKRVLNRSEKFNYLLYIFINNHIHGDFFCFIFQCTTTKNYLSILPILCYYHVSTTTSNFNKIHKVTLLLIGGFCAYCQSHTV